MPASGTMTLTDHDSANPALVLKSGQDNQYDIGSAMPEPEVTETQTEHTTRKICGPDNKLAGLLPGSGPDIDKTTSTTRDLPCTSDLIGLGGNGTLNPDDPDTLDGDVIQPGSTDDDRWETTWHLSRN